MEQRLSRSFSLNLSPEVRHSVLSSHAQSLVQGAIELTNICHGLSVMAGWWHKNGERVGCDADRAAVKIALIHSEVSEALEGFRKGTMDNHLPNRPTEEVELADAVIRIFDLAGARDLDLAGAIVEKLAYNIGRTDHSLEAREASGGKAF